MTSDKRLPPRAWLIVGLLWFVACFNYLARVTITTMHGSIVHSIPMSEAEFGLLTSAFLWIYGLLSPFAGFLSDRFSRSKVILISLFTWSMVTWLTAYATNFHQLLTMRILMGVSEACYLPAALALITDYHRGPTRSLATGVHMTGIMFGSALGGLGGWLAEVRSWHFAFTILGVAGVGYSLVILLFLRDGPREGHETASGAATPSPASFFPAVASLFSRVQFVILLIFWGLAGLIGWVVVGWMPVFMQEHFHLDQATAGISTSAYVNIASLIGVIIGGAWADRWARTNERGRIYVPVIGLCLAAPAILLTCNSSLFALAIVGLVLYGLSLRFSDPNVMPILCMVSNPRYRATGYGVVNSISCLVGGLSIYAGGVLRDAHVDLSVLFRFAAGTAVACGALLLFIRTPKSAGPAWDDAAAAPLK